MSAAAVGLLDRGLFRIGSERYEDENESYGLTTLKVRHLRFANGAAIFEYPSKSGQTSSHEVADPALMPVLKALAKRGKPRENLLTYREGRGWKDLTPAQVNGWIKRAAGEEFSAKDFRTWNATVLAAMALAEHDGEETTKSARKRIGREVVENVAAHLNNTPAVCRASYIDPRVFDRFDSGQTVAGRCGASTGGPATDSPIARQSSAQWSICWSEEDEQRAGTADRRRPRPPRCSTRPASCPRHEGGADRRAVQPRRLGLRAQARRHQMHRDPGRRRGSDAVAQRPALNDRYPELADALEANPRRLRRRRRDRRLRRFQTSFTLLQQRGERHVPVFFYVFDLLWLNGVDVRALPLRARKSLLREAIDFNDPIRFTPHRNGKGQEFFAEACRKGWEGLIAKRADSPYADRRSRDWLKFKCEQARSSSSAASPTRRAPARASAPCSSATSTDGELRYAGKVGTGFDEADAGRHLGTAEEAARSRLPVRRHERDRARRHVHWIRT